MVIIQCPRCNTKTRISLMGTRYEGPFRCGKCRGTFIVKVRNKGLESCKPISEEEFEKYDK